MHGNHESNDLKILFRHTGTDRISPFSLHTQV